MRKDSKSKTSHVGKLRAKGAVSVFLVMILVPCLLVSSIFVDTGRVLLAKNTTRSAADLALDSLLTNYDYDLKEWYGLAASCQTINQFYEVSADYFLRTMQSKGLSDEEIYLVSDYYANATNDDTIFDLLNAKCLTKKDELIKKVKDANLTNPSMMKREIVEFMKYRAPIEITKDLIERLKSPVTGFGDAKEAEKNEQLVDDKSEYYEAEGELLEAAFKSYKAVKAYWDMGLTNNKLKEYADKINKYKESYRAINEKTIANVIYTYDTITNRPRFYLTNYGYGSGGDKFNEKDPQIYSTKTGDGDEAVYTINSSKLDSLCEDVRNKIVAFNEQRNYIETKAPSEATSYPSGDMNPIRWWVKVRDAIGSFVNPAKQAANDLMIAYSKLSAAIWAIDEGKLKLADDINSVTWKSIPGQRKREVEDIYNDSLGDGAAGTNYARILNNLERVSSDYYRSIYPENQFVSVDGRNMSLSAAIPYIASEVNNVRNTLNDAITKLNTAIDGKGSGNSRTPSMDNLKELAKKYATSYSTYKDSARSTDTNMGKEEREIEIPKMEAESDTDKINEAAVTQLKTRLVNIRTQLKNVYNAIDQVQFKGQKIREINSFDVMKGKVQSGVTKNDIPLNNNDITIFADNQFNSKWKPASGNPISLSNMDNVNYNLEINPDTKQVNTPELFIYMREKFKNYKDKDIEDKKNEKKNAKEKGEKMSDDAKNKGRYHYKTNTKSIVKEYSNPSVVAGLGNAISVFIKLFSVLIDDSAGLDQIRDDIYVTSYIMNMFGYATYQDEGMFQLLLKQEGGEDKCKELTVPLIGGSCVPSAYQTEDMKKKWNSEEPTDVHNKTLTNKVNNTTNNAAYCAEVEYILYGKNNGDGNANEENIKSAYTKIFALRYPLNLVSGFQHFWSKSTTTGKLFSAIGYAIQGATSGIIPEALVKVILITVFAAAETAGDLNRLEAGFPVEIYKSSDSDWRLALPSDSDKTGTSFSDATNLLKGDLKAANKDGELKGIYYSDYLTVFVYAGLTDSSVAEQMYKRIGEVMQMNMKQHEGIPSNYSMKKAQVYFELNADVRVKPLMITLPHFAEYKNNLSKNTDWCTYHIRTVRGY